MNQGFRKVATSRWEFCNERFKKGEKELLCEIRRRKAWARKPQAQAQAQLGSNRPNNEEYYVGEEDQRSSSTSSSSEYSSLVDENKRLKKENGVLSSELTAMKRKCEELLQLVAKHANDKKEEDEDEDERPMLFGVRLDVHKTERDFKRNKTCDRPNILLSQSCK